MQYEIVGEPYPAVICHLQHGEQMKTESGSMVWMDPVMQVETTGGGEGLFNTILTGPGTIYLQTMPLSTLVDIIAAHIPTSSS